MLYGLCMCSIYVKWVVCGCEESIAFNESDPLVWKPCFLCCCLSSLHNTLLKFRKLPQFISFQYLSVNLLNKIMFDSYKWKKKKWVYRPHKSIYMLSIPTYPSSVHHIRKWIDHKTPENFGVPGFSFIRKNLGGGNGWPIQDRKKLHA